jgi:omega-hydroxy-beta-dihydromenaquinone-9 sulfotransferase
MHRMNNNTTNKNKRTIQHPLFGISIKNWIKLVGKNGGIDSNYFSRALFITVSSLFFIPARLLFKYTYNARIDKERIQYPPVFIIGHWRSGTTYLHELLCQDPQFCYVSMWNTLLPDSFLVLNPIKKIFSQFLPSERPMDAIKVDIDGPYEDEAALAVLNPWSFFHCFHFPKNSEEQYSKSVHFIDLTAEEKNQWKKNYLRFIKTVIFVNHGKRLLSKNPSNTARIKTLLELFPDACFIHIYRDPYKVFLSTKQMRTRVLDTLALQNISEPEIEQQVITQYTGLMTSYFEQKEILLEHKLIEIKYEDLIIDPIQQVQKIYSTLHLPGLENALSAIQRYLENKTDYKTNVYSFDKKVIQTVNNNWMFTMKRWKYIPQKVISENNPI